MGGRWAGPSGGGVSAGPAAVGVGVGGRPDRGVQLGVPSGWEGPPQGRTGTRLLRSLRSQFCPGPAPQGAPGLPPSPSLHLHLLSPASSEAPVPQVCSPSPPSPSGGPRRGGAHSCVPLSDRPSPPADPPDPGPIVRARSEDQASGSPSPRSSRACSHSSLGWGQRVSAWGAGPPHLPLPPSPSDSQHLGPQGAASLFISVVSPQQRDGPLGLGEWAEGGEAETRTRQASVHGLPHAPTRAGDGACNRARALGQHRPDPPVRGPALRPLSRTARPGRCAPLG